MVDLTKVHYLSGPIGVEGAEPGDLLVVDILDIGVLDGIPTGASPGLFAKTNGGGFLTDHYPDARKACWDFHGIYTSSRHIPNVEFAGIMHPGLIGCLPSKEMLNTWNTREKELFDTDPERVPPLCALPSRRHRPHGPHERLRPRRRGGGRSPHRAAPRARRKLRHQEPHQEDPRSISRSM